MALPPSPSGNSPENKISAEDEVAMREIDEAVRKDDAAEFARKYGVAIGSAILLVLGGLGAYLFWDSQTESALEGESEQLIAALDSAQANDFDGVQSRVEPLLDSETAGVRTSARFLEASAAIEKGESARAVELYQQIAADETAPQTLRDVARIREVVTNYDELSPEEVIAKLKDLAVPGEAFFGTAGELVAIAHIEAGNRAEAGTLFATISKDENLPESLRARARQMTGQLGVDAVEDVDALLEEAGLAPDQGATPGAGPSAQ